jgi:hypothetical protein
MKRALCALSASGWMILLVGCGLAANPEPPTLRMPEPVRDLTAVRIGNRVQLHWVMPKNTTDKVALKGDQRAHICWVSGAAPAVTGKAPANPAPSTGLPGCRSAGDATFAPDKPADFAAEIPAELIAGSPQVVSVFVELQNDARKTAGPSNPVWIATGPAPAAVAGLHVETSASGVVLHWESATAQAGMVMRIHRALVSGNVRARSSEANGVPPANEQTLEVGLDKSDSGQALDRDASLDHTWKYTVERVVRVELDHHALEIAGLPSQPVTLDAIDVFPPAVPAGLAVVVDDQAHALDLSWNPDVEADLAGYVVYRREVTGGTTAERISGKALIVPPSFEDKDVAAGHRYAYSVSAVDEDGNESGRSPEVEEGLP